MDRATAADLNAIVIASPCTVPWETMTGEGTKRFCSQCRLHVHDVANMTREEVTALRMETNGEVCLRIWRRPDGRVITKDCQRVRRALKRSMRAVGAAAAAVLAFVGLGGCTRTCCEPARPTAAAPAPAPTPPPAARPAEKPPVKGATVVGGR
jgi:hypothetical protein